MAIYFVLRLPDLLELLVFDPRFFLPVRVLVLFFPRPEPPGFLPPLSCAFTVLQARSSASFFETPRFS
ncbi:MAG: hypothetical protein H0W04_04690 [Chthoniobacterales bacterium]|nr:hypothetical protein [Chthoniobacterales bacterium]